jgi:lysophospholipase L1-like esterase
VTYVRLLYLLLLTCCTPTSPTIPARVITFGDSNVDLGFAGRDSVWVTASYISFMSYHLPPTAPNDPHQLAGKIEHLADVQAVNHGISGTTTGDGFRLTGVPNARGVVHGVTRFEAEVLGLAAPWESGDGVVRIQAFSPTANDFALVSMGTNDGPAGMTVESTAENLTWMVARWRQTGHPSDHLILTTLPPFDRNRPDLAAAVQLRNERIRRLAVIGGAGLIDIAAYLSTDGITWRDSLQQVGDGIHYSESVRDWLAAKVVDYIQAH